MRDGGGSAARRRVAVVTGGGGGIGSEACFELARQGVAVIAMDPGVGLEGEPLHEPTAEAVADKIRASGGTARSCDASVTDRDAVRDLFRDVVDEFGALDIVINTAGILRFPSFFDAGPDDWDAVLDVHFNGYLNVLAEALPIMAEAGYGRIVGVTSGVGLARTSAGGLAYGAAKRSVAAVSWELREILPAGVRVNVLSPIAASRMVRRALEFAGTPAKGLDLSAMPQPADMAPAAAYLASEQFGSWAAGQVVFSAGPELSVIGPPRLTEIVRSEGAVDFAAALGTVVPVVLHPAETEQRTTGGSNPRYGNVFDHAPPPLDGSGNGHVVVVAEDARLIDSLAKQLKAWTRKATFVPAGGEFRHAEQSLTDAVAASGPFDAVVVALGAPDGASADSRSWTETVESHRGVARYLVGTAGWLRAAARLSAAGGHPLRVVFATDATSPAGRTAAQAVAQMARSANDTPADIEIDAMAIGAESAAASDTEALAALAARLATAADTRGLRGAELAVGRGWVGIRSHPGPVATVSFGSTDIPDWVDSALRQAATNRHQE
jgi:NAD(P)-dependent dehydrogenase (short-subunit alcohol dehydrogenase family)